MPDPLDPIAALNPFSRGVVHLTAYFKDPYLAVSEPQKLATGTGFIREIGDRYFLITARHNLTGRDPNTNDAISCTCGIPNEIVLDGFHVRYIGHQTIPMTQSIAHRSSTIIQRTQRLMLLFFRL